MKIKHNLWWIGCNDSILSTSTKAQLIYGGKDSDTIAVSSEASDAPHSISGEAGADKITGSSGAELLDGGTQDDSQDTILSGGGNDTIYGRAGNDLINLEAGSNAGAVVVQAGNGDDVIEVSLGELTYLDTIKGEKGTDTIAVVGNAIDFNMWETNTQVTKAFDSISNVETLAFGSSANDYTINGTKEINLSSRVQLSGITTIDARKVKGSGNEVLAINAFQFTSRANLTFFGSEDKDVNVKFTGGSGDDTITTGKITDDGSDTLTGGFGEDTFNIIATNEKALITDLGTGGDDTLIVNQESAGVTATVKEDYTAPSSTKNLKSLADVVLDADSGIDIDMSNAIGNYGYVINGGVKASNLRGSSFSDSIFGNERGDTLYGYLGDDTITGGGGADQINTGRGNGTVQDAGNGEDIINHSEGNFTLIYNTGTDLVTLEASRAGAYVVNNSTGVRKVNASTSTAAVTLDGRGAGDNKVTYEGGLGDDSILGGIGGDELTGNNGNDTITGGLSADTISVGGGSNTVIFTGGLTKDEISGFTNDDVGSFDLSEIKTRGAVTDNAILDIVTGAGTTVQPSDSISLQTITGNNTVLAATTNILHYTSQVSDADALEVALENGGSGIITTAADGALAINDAFIIQYQDSETNSYTCNRSYRNQ